MNKATLLTFLGFIFILLFANVLQAQNAQDKEVKRPKIGLVLSGGGAKGLAHIGVLKVLEELDIHPDYITGVSMGSIVGGLYSIGYSAHELDSLTSAIDWNTTFSDKMSYEQIGMNVKNDYDNYQIKLSGNKLNDISLPLGMINGQFISELLSQLSWRVVGINSFDDFPIPFRCFAADIISGRSIMFDSGVLPHAIRASMSIPTVFTPIVQDSMLLVDGGIMNNFPVQQCIDMGADIVIGVYVGSNEKLKANDLNTMVKILNHSASFSGIVNAREQLKHVNIKIIPDLNGAGVESFGRAEEIVNYGEEAARKEDVYAQLKALSDSLKKFPQVQNIKHLNEKTEIAIHSIHVDGLKYVTKDFVIGTSEITENSMVNSQLLDEALKRLYGTLIFDKIDYHFEKNEGKMDLVFDVIEKDRINLNASVYYDNFFGAGMLINASYKHLLVKSSKLDLLMDISQYPRINLNYTLIGGKRKRLFFTLGVKTQSIVIPNFYEFPNSLIVSMGQFRNNQLDLSSSLGVSITKISKLEFSASHVNNYFQLQGGLDELYGIRNVSSNNYALETSFKLNTLDHPFFPTKGAKLDIQYTKIIHPVTSYSSPEGMFKPISDQNERIVVNYKHYIRFARRYSIIPHFTLGFMRYIPFYADKFFLGGSGFNTRTNSFNMAGVQPFHIATDNFVQLGLGAQAKINDNWYVSGLYQYAKFINNAETSSEQSLEIDGESISGWAASIAYNSMIGPLKFTVTQNLNSSLFYYYFTLGFPF